jgi:hypothetical protein
LKCSARHWRQKNSVAERLTIFRFNAHATGSTGPPQTLHVIVLGLDGLAEEDAARLRGDGDGELVAAREDGLAGEAILHAKLEPALVGDPEFLEEAVEGAIGIGEVVAEDGRLVVVEEARDGAHVLVAPAGVRGVGLTPQRILVDAQEYMPNLRPFLWM